MCSIEKQWIAWKLSVSSHIAITADRAGAPQPRTGDNDREGKRTMPYGPRGEYVTTQKIIRLRDFYDYADAYVTRPPYQRKRVWSRKKKQALMDSLLRRYYVPRLVLRQVRLSETRTVDEVIDGQQRISTLHGFFSGEFALPRSLSDLGSGLAGTFYRDLDVDVRKYVDQLELQADRILNIEDRNSAHHQRVATEIFWRLQQGESLNTMEVAHARLASRTRNFLVKYADDASFDYERYWPVDCNPHKHPFFSLVNRGNDRMEHLALLARMLLIERDGGYAELKDTAIQELVEKNQTDNGIGDESYETETAARAVICNLGLFYDVFSGQHGDVPGERVRELNREYVILSFYVLIRHINLYYVFDETVTRLMRRFFDDFHRRWRLGTVDDLDIARFSENSQQDSASLRERDIILRQEFFRFLAGEGDSLVAKDGKRRFNEAERIEIYRRDQGLCQGCLADGKPEREARVSWSDYQADHIIAWINGGATDVENGQVLCRYHNSSKGASGGDGAGPHAVDGIACKAWSASL